MLEIRDILYVNLCIHWMASFPPNDPNPKFESVPLPRNIPNIPDRFIYPPPEYEVRDFYDWLDDEVRNSSHTYSSSFEELSDVNGWRKIRIEYEDEGSLANDPFDYPPTSSADRDKFLMDKTIEYLNVSGSRNINLGVGQKKKLDDWIKDDVLPILEFDDEIRVYTIYEYASGHPVKANFGWYKRLSR